MVLNQACIYVSDDKVEHLAVVTRSEEVEFTNSKQERETYTATDVFVYDYNKVVNGVSVADSPTVHCVSPI